MLALLLALAWVPLTSHCQIESASGLEFLRCSPPAQNSTATDDHCGDAACCAIEKGNCHAPAVQQLAARPVFAPPSPGMDPASEPLLLARHSPSPPAAPPPELSTSWQFVARAALPVRAPSLLS